MSEEPKLAELRIALDDLMWAFSRRLAVGDHPGGSVGSPDGETSDARIRAARLARLVVYKEIVAMLALGMYRDVRIALEHGAQTLEIAGALGTTRQVVEKRFARTRSGNNVVVVISRRAPLHEDIDDPHPRDVATGAGIHYESDRGTWPIGRRVRSEARYAVAAVDGVVRRVYALDAEAWDEPEPDMWRFAAVDDRCLTESECAAAYEAGEIPFTLGSDCPIRIDGPYHPHRF